MIDILEVYRYCNEPSDDDEDLVDFPSKKIICDRRNREDTVKYVFNSPEALRECDNMQVECIGFGDDPYSVMRFRRHDMWTLHNGDAHSDTVIVAVEACTICPIDVMVRRGMLNEDIPAPFVPGCNFVGIVHHCGSDAEDYDISEGSRVASLVKWGGNSRYVSLSADKLIRVPKNVDSSEASYVLSTYLPAFQALHHGRSKASRYSQTALKGKVVLVTDGMSMEGQAVIKLAYWSGAFDVYAVGKREHHKRLKALGARPLDEDPEDWLDVVEGLVDVLVHFGFPTELDAVRASLNRKGRIVCYARPSPDKAGPGFSWMTEIQNLFELSTLSMIKRCSLYDPFYSWECFPDLFKRDLAFLFALLIQRQIRPNIDRFITLNGVPGAHDDLQSGVVNGAIVCEPWKD